MIGTFCLLPNKSQCILNNQLGKKHWCNIKQIIILEGGSVQGQGIGQRFIGIVAGNDYITWLQEDHSEHWKCPKSSLQAKVTGV